LYKKNYKPWKDIRVLTLWLCTCILLIALILTETLSTSIAAKWAVRSLFIVFAFPSYTIFQIYFFTPKSKRPRFQSLERNSLEKKDDE